MTARRLLLGVAAWLAGIAAVSAAAAEIRVTPLVAGGRVFASFEAAGAIDADARAVMRSGLLLTFTYTVDLRRPSTIWLDHNLARKVVSATVKFDTLTGVYHVSKLEGDRVVSSDTSSDESQVRAWMTTFERVPISPADPLEPNGDYYVRVRLHASPKGTFFFWPWGRDDGSGRADFTFIR